MSLTILENSRRVTSVDWGGKCCVRDIDIGVSPFFEVSGDLIVWFSRRAAVSCDEKYILWVTNSIDDD